MFTPVINESLDWSIVEIPNSLPLLSSLTNSYETTVDYDQNLKYVIDPTKEEFDRFLEQRMATHCEILSKSYPMFHAN